MKNLIKKWVTLSLLLGISTVMPALAQDITITGKVTDQKDKSWLPGVTVSVKGRSKVTTTDGNGNYSIAARASEVLIFKSVGFTSKEVGVSTANGNTLNVALVSDVTNLNDVVVVGYGTQRRKDVTGSVASVDKSRLEQLPNTNFAQALQGSLPGVSVDQNSGGAEGNNNSIVIRGKNSITATNDPLIVLDGIPYNGSISDINPPDIENIDVLKDASATAIYGSRGANGVILVTTKKGKRGKPSISYDGFYGIQKFTNLPDMLSPEEFYTFKRTREPNTAITTSEQAVYDSKNFPNWVDLATRTGSRSQHTLGVTGGSDNSRYYVSATYLDVKGVALGDNFKRLSTRINLETNVTSWLTYGTNTQLSYNNRSGLAASFNGDYGAYRFNPLTTAYNANGTLTVYPWPDDTFFANPLAPTLASNNDETYKVISTNYLNVQLPVKGLSYRLNTGIEYTSRDQSTYYGRDTRTGFKDNGNLSLGTNLQRNVLIENIVNYNRSFGKHAIGFTGLYSYQYDNIKINGLDATGFPNDVLTYYQANVALSKTPSANYSKQTLISQMGRLNYSYNGKYLLTLTGRRDGFSGFGANKKFSFFPSVALGWNISEEDFVKNINAISNLKLRLSYGSNGNQAVGTYRTLARLAERSYVNGSATAPGYIPTSLANPDLGWETTKSLNVGIDFGLFKGRLTGTIDAYTAKTRDLLLKRQISPVHGIDTITQNIGKTANKGIELGLNSINIKSSKFTWTSNANISINRNKIVELYGNGKSDTLNNWFLNKPIDVNFDYTYGGVWQTTDDLSKSPQPNTKAGYAKVVDYNNDGKIDARDKTIIGSRQPDFTWGLGNTLTYKNFSLYVFAQGVVGTSRRNTFLADDVNSGVRYNTTRKNWWTPTNPTNEYYANDVNANIYGVRIFESDSYLRVKDISLSYNLTGKLLRQIKLSRVKVYFNMRNAFTITKWTGLDPELNTQDAIPLQKEFILGLNIGL
ncbi:TonB-dependent receptor [Mucilaginibacter sp. PAMB04168]|uniref:SusC/RagA family TonB-linked outer membrane protein n=1 Tax=Mucilaginibacter sp. PAMB04168 TaxID=3138567 RepID=UPI0031F67ECF